MDEELRSRLQEALAASYQLERELTGGGMGRVFVAREHALGRQVVVKVLPSDVAAGVSIERFRREIQLAAQLQHPHIVPLLSAGEASGLPYFTMPYVTGESLRLRLATGELPMQETVRILREVASALEFAHSHGVVHRDVKPDNVLLSAGSAMVTDFGVAKALSVSTHSEHSATVTSIGVALGTPAYMSPEQAAADARIDHRADIYAFGCLAYEMLTGATPFSGRSASATLAAQVNDAPEDIRRRRATVSPPLAQVIMRCLQKSPADRPQHASEIVHALDALSTPSGGLPPATASMSGRMRLYAAAAIAVVLMGAAYATGRFGGIGGSGTTSIAVLPFVSADTSDEFFADGMTDDLASALGKVEGLRVAARSSAYSFKGKRTDVKEVGVKLNVGTVLEGTVRRAGTRLRITAQLVNVGDGLTMWSDSWDRDAKDVFAVQDEISRSIVGALRISLSGETARRLTSHGTTNAQAHELYLRGRFLMNRFTRPDLEQSLRMFRQALVVDSNFAPAWVGIADAFVNLADDWLPPREAYPQAKVAALRALALEVSAEAHSSMATIHMWYDWDGVLAEAELRRAIQLQPDYARAHHYLGRLQAIRLDYAAAIASLGRATELDPLAPRHFSMLASVLNSAGRHDEAIAAARGALAIDPHFGPGHYEIGNALLARGDVAGAHAEYTLASLEGNAWAPAGVAAALVRSRRAREARAVAASLVAQRAKAYVAGDHIAASFAAIGDIDAAFRWLDSAVTDRSGPIPEIFRYNRLDPLRADPRWATLVRKINWK